MRARTARLVASLAKAHKVNGGTWGYYNFAGANGAGMFGLAAWLTWNDLSGVDQELVRKVMEAEANSKMSFAVPYYRDAAGAVLDPGDTKAEDLGRMAEVLGLAVSMMPGHPNRQAWEAKSVEMILAGFARPQDVTRPTPYHGRPLSAWLNGSNVESDGIVTNHDRNPHPHYMADVGDNGMAAIAYTLAGQAVPQAALFNLENVYAAFVDRSFTGPGYRAPGGTIYVRGSGELYFPQPNDHPYNEFMKYVAVDVTARQFAGDSASSVKAEVWEPLHAQRALDLLGQTEAGVLVDQRDYINASWAARAYLIKWLGGQRVFRFHNDDVGLPSNPPPPPPPPPADTTAPSVPANLVATGSTSSQIDLAWTASTDGVGVTGYRVVRNGSVVATVSGTTYRDSGLTPATSYSYTVRAIDAAGNQSAESSALNATTAAAPAAPAFVSAITATVVNGRSVGLGVPAGAGPGQVLIAVIRQSKTTAAVTAPAGWRLIREDSGVGKVSLYYQVLTGRPASTSTFTFAATATADATVLRYRGVDPTDPITANGAGKNSGKTTGTKVDAPSLTAPQPGTLYLAFWSARVKRSVTAPSGTVERTDTALNATLSVGERTLGAAGATGTTTGSLSGSSDGRIGQSLLLRPA